MNSKKQIDLRDFPSWKYFGWGLLNGLFLGISIKFGVDIDEAGILTQVLNAFKPIFQSVNMSTTWINLWVILLGLIGIISLVGEIIVIYKKGWIPRILAGCGFLSLFLLILGIDSLGVIFLIGGAVLVALFPNE